MSKFLKSCASVMIAAALLSAISTAIPGTDMPAAVTAYAETTGQLSDTVSYSLSDDGTVLTISGSSFRDVIPRISSISGYENITSVIIEGSSIEYIGRYAFEGCSSLTSVKISNNVTEIGDGAFQGCSSLTSITIPNSVTAIGMNAFEGCSNLTNINVGIRNSNYSSVDGVLFDRNRTTIIKYPAGKKTEFYSVPDCRQNIRK